MKYGEDIFFYRSEFEKYYIIGYFIKTACNQNI
jgi:hypothetical protein